MRGMRTFILAMTGALVLLSCTDDSYRGSADMAGVSDGPVPVMVVVGNPDNMFVSKGHGGIDNNTQSWKGAPVYIYGFNRDLNVSYTATSEKDSWNCLVDGSRDNPGSKAGKKASIGELDAYVSWEGPEEVVYYPASTQPYDFYAYYLDDIAVPEENISRTDDYVSMKVEIDGSQDLMSAKAALIEEQLAWEGYTEEERLNIINYAYSAYTASLNIPPVIYFKHHLTRLCFDVYPGFTTASGKRVFVDAIEVRSRTRGVFTVASKSADAMGVDFSSDDRSADQLPYLNLRGDGGSNLIPVGNPDFYEIKAYSGDPLTDVYSREPMRVGESLLVAPDTEYRMRLHLREVMSTGNVYEYQVEKTLTASGGQFLPGNQYTIRLAVYGMDAVNVSVALTPWGYGGKLTVGEDEPPTPSRD